MADPYNQQKAFENGRPHHQDSEPHAPLPYFGTPEKYERFKRMQKLRKLTSSPEPISYQRIKSSPMLFTNREDVLDRLGLNPLPTRLRDDQILHMPGIHTDNPQGEVAVVWQPLRQDFNRHSFAEKTLYVEVAAGPRKISMVFTPKAEKPTGKEMQLDAMTLHYKDVEFSLLLNEMEDARWMHQAFAAARDAIDCLRAQNGQAPERLAAGLRQTLCEIAQKPEIVLEDWTYRELTAPAP